jgi:hypothetical protein
VLRCIFSVFVAWPCGRNFRPILFASLSVGRWLACFLPSGLTLIHLSAPCMRPYKWEVTKKQQPRPRNHATEEYGSGSSHTSDPGRLL